jgi:hypothetical protein
MEKSPITFHNNAGESRKDRAIEALLKYGTKEKAAQEVGIHPATLWRWQKDPKFQQALRERRREAFSQTVSRLQLASTTAVDTLLAIMADQEAPAGSRVRAAQCVVELSHRSLELQDLEARIVTLEQTAGDTNGSHKP